MTRRHSFINFSRAYNLHIAPRKRIRIPKSEKIRENFQGKFWLWNPESWALESGIQLKESGILLTIVIQNPRSTCSTDMTKTGIQYLESRIQGVESRIQDCHGSPYNGRYSSFAFPFVWFKLVSTNTPFYSLCSVWSLFCLRSLISLSFSLLPFLVLSLFKYRFSLPLYTILLTQLILQFIFSLHAIYYIVSFTILFFNLNQ